MEERERRFVEGRETEENHSTIYLGHLFQWHLEGPLRIHQEGKEGAIDGGLSPVPPLHTQINLPQVLPERGPEEVPQLTIVLLEDDGH